MILAIKTDAPTVELILAEPDGTIIRREEWLAERRLALELVGKLASLLQSAHGSWEQVRGLVVFKGPGSFTGLRIGITVMNTIAYSQNIPICGQEGEQWLQSGIDRLKNKENDHIVLPEYGALPRITQPKK